MKEKYLKEKESFTKISKQAKTPAFLSLMGNLLADLSPRSRDIIEKRFGLGQAKGETLERIGNIYGITRERVRQIIFEAMKIILKKSNNESFIKAEERIVFTIAKNNGIIKESEVIDIFNSDGAKEANAIKFFASCSKNIFEIEEKECLEKSWVISSDTQEQVKKIVKDAQKILNEKKKILTDNEIVKELLALNPELSSNQILNFLKISYKIKKNKFDKWGMRDWTEISPKGTREKVYLILKEGKKPLHFTQIAKLIDQYHLGKRKAHPQTVHNELIKDNRFILVGRGIYALAEWGYSKGTIKDVLTGILEKNSRPLSREELIKKVLEVRRVQKATILINLNNSKIFQKQKDFYSIKK